MKGGTIDIVNKKECKNFLRISKTFVKLNFYLKSYGISQPALSRFMNNDDYDAFISEKNLNKLVDEIYSSCKLYCDLYEEKKKIA